MNPTILVGRVIADIRPPCRLSLDLGVLCVYTFFQSQYSGSSLFRNVWYLVFGAPCVCVNSLGI